MEILNYAIATCVGSGLTLVSNYILEDRKFKNDRFKYRIDKLITVGEEYYKFSTYSLMYLTSLIDTIDKREEYMSEGGQHILNVLEEEGRKQIERIRDNNITITTASFYFNVTDSEKAVKQMLIVKEANIKMHHYSSIQDYELYQNACNEFLSAINSIINQIKTDQLIISNNIKKLLNTNNIK